MLAQQDEKGNNWHTFGTLAHLLARWHVKIVTHLALWHFGLWAHRQRWHKWHV